MRPGPLIDRNQRQPWRTTEALAGAGDEDIRRTSFRMNIHAGERGNGIDQNQRAMRAADAPDLGNGVESTGGGVVMDDGNDGDIRPLFEGGFDRGRIDRLVVRHLDLDQLLVVARRPVPEALAVHSGSEI